MPIGENERVPKAYVRLYFQLSFLQVKSYYTFTDSLTKTELKRFSAKCKELDNPRWQQINSATRTFVSNRVEMRIRNDGFTIQQSHIGGSPPIDSIPNLTLPLYELESHTKWFRGPDYTDDIVIKLKKVPASSFYKL